MSESSPPFVVDNLVGDSPPVLTSEEIATVLADFQSWLSALRVLPEEVPAGADTAPDLFTLLAQFTALRHEVNLQTKAIRAREEQNSAALTQMIEALDALNQLQDGTAKDQDEHLRPLLKTLVELHDALSIAGREAQRVQDIILPALQIAAEASSANGVEPPSPPKLPALVRWLSGSDANLTAYTTAVANWQKRESERTGQIRANVEHIRRLLTSLTSGYTMSLQRLERALQQHGLEAIPSTGCSFDPEQMEVVEAVTDSGRPAGQVLDEIRRGYLWKDRVFRYAQVRVAKG